MNKNDAELWIETNELPGYGRETARSLGSAGRRSARREAGKLRDSRSALEAMCKGDSLAGTEAGEWLRDNLYILRRDAALAASELSHARRLPMSEKGVPRICALAKALVRAGRGSVDEARLRAFFSGLRQTAPPEERELSLLPAALRSALIVRLAENPENGEAVFGSLRWLDTMRSGPLLASLSPIEERFLRDPAGIYPAMDEESRGDYRYRTAKLAEAVGLRETEAADRILSLAEKENRHIGEFILDRPLGKPAPQKPYAAYLSLKFLLPAAAALLLGFCAGSAAAALLTFLPLRDAVKFLFDRVCTRLVPPRRLPRLDYSRGIPPESRTLAVSAVLLTSPEEAAAAAARLESFRLANRDAGKELVFGLLADLRESDTETEPSDAGLLAAAANEIDRLNRVYGGGFCLFSRPRSYSARDRIWRPRERKRGAVMELTELLRGGESGLVLTAGDAACAEHIRFLIVLDGDTMLDPGSAARLAGILAHPHQQSRREGKRRGRALLQPRLGVDLRDASRSDFSRIFAGQGGLDPYGGLNSDVYQDLFEEGSYAGKGILDVDAFRSCLRGRFPPETLLSHDLLEGAAAGCAFVSDVTLTEGFPSGLLSYFRRQHRWIRGDWQTLPWLFPRVRNEAGETEPNPLTPLGKWKILDNLLRSLTPASELAALCFCGFFPGRASFLCIGTALACLLLRIAALSPGRAGHSRRYRSRLLSAAGVDFMQFLWLLVLLPYRVWIHVSAVALSLYRSFISKKNMLAWVTAAEGDRRGSGGPLLYLRSMWICLPVGVLWLLFAWTPLRALGPVWFSAPLLGWFLSRPRDERQKPGEDERILLLHCAGDILHFFEDTVTAEFNYLPPDNLQEDPVRRIAERTSPTNVGLYLLSCLAAADLGIWSRTRSWTQIGRTLDTLQKLPKYRGHLYNWYDIRSCEPLRPPFISTVDSGNLLACLVILERAAAAEGREEEAARVRALHGEMDLGFLYDGERELLHIGWDPAKDAPAGGHYDLLESEARIASFLAVARGQAPLRHWRRLGRTLSDDCGTSGLASWTGTMFEYLMPALFMPEPRGSLLGDSREFCLRVQRSRTPGGVWGMSESAFAEMDAAENYAYKAHGVQGLALKRGMDLDSVIAPYASFLALAECPRAALRNLRRLRSLGAEGPYGFLEALDFTPSRREGADFRPVRCFMSHHLGMSLLAIDNRLNEGILQRRFMEDPSHLAFRSLLEEKVPAGQRIRPVKDYRADPVPERRKSEGLLLTRESFDPLRPAFFPLRAGGVRLVMSELGSCSVLWDPPGNSSRTAPHGDVLFFAAPEHGLVSLQPMPAPGEDARHRCSWDGKSVSRYARGMGLEFRILTQLSGRGGEVRRITVVNEGREKRQVTLAMYTEPILCPPADYAAHPAFHRLCLESRLQGDVLTVSRRPGGTAAPCAMAIVCSGAWEAETDKALAFGRGGILNMPAAIRRSGSDVRAASEPCIFLRTKLTLRPGQAVSADFVIAFGLTEDAAAATARALLRVPDPDGSGLHRACRLPDERLTPEEALSLLTPLLAETPDKRRRRAALPPEERKTALWRYGVSGDLPAAAAGEAEGERLLAAWAFLHGLGVSFDLCIRTEDEGIYGRPRAAALRALAIRLGVSAWEDKMGGFRFVGGTDGDWRAFCAAADAVGMDKAERHPRSGPARPHFLPECTESAAERTVRFTEEGCVCTTARGAGRRAWSLPITNGRLGWLASDSGSGNLWLNNARENRLTPWENDPLALEGPEKLVLLRGSREYSLMADGQDVPTEITFGFGWVRWHRRFGETDAEVTGFIPPENDIRILLIRLREWRETDRIRFSVHPVSHGLLGVSASEAPRRPCDADETETGGLSGEFSASAAICIALGPGPQPPVSVPEAEDLLRAARSRWQAAVSAIRVETPSAALNAYLNGWAVYQTLACRMLARCSLYQSGGAYGFRDQLQDICALADGFPSLAREHLLRAAAHQYEEGDVMHWWHPGTAGDRGVRTRCSDDLLWLPYACTVYVEKTGDASLWESAAPWLRSAPLEDGERDRYEMPEKVGSGSLLEHCRRAVRLAEARGTGAHGLMLFGSGDWCDGMDRVAGESVWLTWFAALVMDRFGRAVGDGELRRKAECLGAAADAAWADGQYLRGYYADGRPLGSAWNAECSLDSLSQSFAVLSGFGDPVHSRAAVCRAADRLLDREHRLVMLFTPPFNGATDPGYIRSYLPGVRENGGQYTHAAVWLAAACLRCGEEERGWRILEALLPTGREERVYQAEPFVLAADVYSNPDMPGRGGWSWYTGAAGWFLRCTLEELLGVRTRGGEITVDPRIPAAWSGYALRLRAGGKELLVRVRRGAEGWDKEILPAEPPEA